MEPKIRAAVRADQPPFFMRAAQQAEGQGMTTKKGATQTAEDKKPAARKAAAKKPAAKKTPLKKPAAKEAEAKPAPEQEAQPTPAAEPAPKRKPARPWTVRARTAFLEALGELGQVRAAARAAGISPQQAYRQRQKCPDFAREWNEAMDRALDTLEEVLLDRAMNGVEKPVYYGGKSCGSVRQYSDALAMFLLRARRPETYGRAATGETPATSGATGDKSDPVALIEARLRALAAPKGEGVEADKLKTSSR